MSVAQIETGSPDSLRALALFIATYVDRWSSLMSLHQAVLAQFPATTAEATMAEAIVPRLLAHLEQRDAQATAQQDLLHHAVIQPALEALRARSAGDATGWQPFWQRLHQVAGEVRSVLEARYDRQLQGEALAAHLQVAVADLPALLCRSRSQLDWIASPGEWSVGSAERMLPTLIEEFLCDSIDPDSRQLLIATLNRDLTHLARFQRQWRLHVLLSAAFARLPFAPTRATTDHGSNRVIVLPDVVPVSRPSARKVSSGDRVIARAVRVPRYQKIPVTWMVAGGCLLLAALLMVPLNRSDTAVATAPTIPTAQPVPSSSPTPRPTEVSKASTGPVSAPVNSPTTTATPLPSSLPTSPSTSGHGGIETAKAINLLKLIDLNRDVVSGKWQMNNGTLRVEADKDSYGRLQIPVARVAEYDLRAVLTRVERIGAITMMGTYDNEQFTASIASHGNRLAGFARVRGMQLDGNPTCKNISGAVINGKRYTVLLEVRRKELRLSLDGTVVSTWTPALGALSANPNWALRDKTALGLGSFGSIIDFHEVTYTPRDESGTAPKSR